MNLPSAPPTLRFDHYVVDLRSRELRKNGTRIRVQEKPLLVLAALANNQGELVTVDFEVGVNTAVKKLRAALGDDADAPRYIETIPRSGYRFLVPVEIAGNGQLATKAPPNEVDLGVVLPAISEEKRIPPATSVTHRPWLRVALVALILLIGFGFWWLTPLPEPKILQIYPVTDTARLDFLVHPATDGARIFFVQRAGDHYDLMQASVNGGDAVKMDAPFPNSLIWDVSPDGTQYLMTSFARRGDPSQLWSWPVTGAPPVKLDDMISGSATYSPDGKMIAYHIHRDLWIGNADGSGKRKLGTFDHEVDDPAWSPDGKRLRFTQKDEERDTLSIWEIGLDGQGLRPVLPHWTNSSHACCGSWTPDGRYFIFVEAAARSKLWALREKGHWLRRSPSGPFLLASEAGGSWSPLIARDGKHLYFYGNGLQVIMETLDVATHQFKAFLPGLSPIMPGFSRDGAWVAYIRTTPDGKTLAFTAQTSGRLQNAFVVDAGGGRPEQLIAGRENLRDPDWSGDGSQLVVTEDSPASSREANATMLALVSWPNRQLREIPGSEGLHQPRWSPNGRWIAALWQDQTELRLYDVAANQWRTLARGKVIGLPVWSSDSAYLYFQDSGAAGEPLARIKLSSGAAEFVADFQALIDTGIRSCAFFALTSDGHPMISFDRRRSDIYGATLVAP